MNALATLTFTVLNALIAAWCATTVLRSSARAIWRSPVFYLYGSFALIVWTPVCAYFLIFYADWFVLYLFRADETFAWIPFGILLIASCALAAFILGAYWVRSHKVGPLIAFAFCWTVLGLSLQVWLWPRTYWLSSYDQFHAHVARRAWLDTSLFASQCCAIPILILGSTYIWYVLRSSRP
jgi:hypothetical protein